MKQPILMREITVGQKEDQTDFDKFKSNVKG